METKNYNPELRALLSIRNFKKALQKHYEQMMQIEKNFQELNENALFIIQGHCSKEALQKWKNNLSEINSALEGINEILSKVKEKIVKKDRSDSSQLWRKFDKNLIVLKAKTNLAEKMGFEILPKSEHKHWQKDICNFDETVLPLIDSHAHACKLELEMIEKYSPKELHKITQIVLEHIPDGFTFEEADKYEKDYLKAVEDLKQEFKKEKNLWDKFLDILAGGKHQSPSQRVMMQRWLEGEKHDL